MPESCVWVARSSEEVLLAIVEVALSGIIGDSVACIAENRGGQEGCVCEARDNVCCGGCRA